jgi:prophage antirepressor-like protein
MSDEQLPADSRGKMVVFGARQIRRIWHEEQWFFSVVDIIAVLTDSDNPRNYWNMMKAREQKQCEVQLSTFCVQLKLTSSDGKSYKTDCVNIEAAFRLIQSIPSPKAEPFKRWLAKVGYERVQEIENPELAQQRMRELYRQKGYPADWIEKRVRSIAVRDELTDRPRTDLHHARRGRDHRNRPQQRRPRLCAEQAGRPGRRDGGGQRTSPA